MRELR
jgi:hypothetical protein